jgi:hypothetical protein
MIGNGIGGRDTKTMEGAEAIKAIEAIEAIEAKKANEGISISSIRA